MPKSYRRFIRLNGELYPSPRFTSRADANQWYEDMRRKKQYSRDGITQRTDKNGLKFFDFAKEWIQARIKNYPAATWKSDEQRLRDYVLPALASMPIASITSNHVRDLLREVTDAGRDVKTRTRVKALLSVMFSDAFNADPPLVNSNPVLGIKFKERRAGKKKPSYLDDSSSCLKALQAAGDLGPIYLVIVSLGMMAGLRKQEMAALKWRNVDFESKTILITEKLEQTTLTIRKGTKGGENAIRSVPIPNALVSVLKAWQKESKFSGETDFVLTIRDSGNFMSPRTIYDYHVRVCRLSGLEVTVHGLRHTFGREFAAKSGNMRALQAILGHSSGSTTELYSELSGTRLEPFGEVVHFDIGNGVKRSKE